MNRLKCTYCSHPIIPSNSYGYDEMGYEGNGTVTIYSCDSEDCTVDEIYIFEPHNEEN